VRIANVNVVYRKELTDMLRDRRSIFMMIFFPVIIFPLLTVGFGRFEEKMRRKAEQEAAALMVLGAENAPQLAARLEKTEGLHLVPSEGNYVQQISDKKLRAAVEIPEGFEQALAAGSPEPPRVQIYFYETELRSEAAARRVEEILRDYRDEIIEARLAERQLSPGIVKPVETKRENVATPEKVSGLKLGGLLPYFIIILCMAGAMHPAMDLTAGEKERGTMETILASAVGRRELVVGKFLLVLTASLVTTVTSLTSFAVTVKFLGGAGAMMGRGGAATFHVSPQAIGSVFLLVFPLAVLFSSGVLAVSLFAKSYKEAQSYLSPLMLLVLLPAIAALLPGVELNPRLALVPILNVSLTAKEILTGNYPWGSILVVFGSTCAYAIAALSVAVHLFQREEVLFRT